HARTFLRWQEHRSSAMAIMSNTAVNVILSPSAFARLQPTGSNVAAKHELLDLARRRPREVRHGIKRFGPFLPSARGRVSSVHHPSAR
ncbi:MAG TPA: hypothetical protein VKJ07_08735, partial [Mycobacteriales bacterium]|nr:hypothetical protein [Mycobacteriales bacterium]